MSYKPIVTAFLPIVLLAACSEPPAPGGSSSAGNQPAAAQTQGVRVARWTPGEPRMLAVARGTLMIVNGCLALSDFGQSPVLPVFPYGHGEWSDANQTLTYRGATFRVGDTVQFGGGGVQRGSHWLTLGPNYIPDCGMSDLFLVG